jgi:hypothetical protein
VDKDFFVSQLVTLSRLYFVEVLGFCCMSNHIFTCSFECGRMRIIAMMM